MSALTLYHSPRACSRVPLILLQAAQADFELRIVRLDARENQSETFQRLNPKAKVPVLVRDAQVLTENVAIATWIAQQFAQARLMPAMDDGWACAQALSWLAWGATTLHPAIFRARMAQRVVEGGEAQASVRTLALADLLRQLQVAEQRLAAGPWLLGERWMAPDAYLFWCTGRAAEAGVDMVALPRVAAHAERMGGDAAVVEALRREEEGI